MLVNKTFSNFGNKNFCKIVVGGDGAVGKTTLSQRLVGTLKIEEDRLMTHGIDFHCLKIEDGNINAQLWDLGGQEQFRSFQESLLRNALIAIFVFSVELFPSFLNLEHWLSLISNEHPLKIYLIGNKIDTTNRAISTEEALKLAESRNMTYFEISALRGTGFYAFKEDLIITLKSIFSE